jgi:hypothetical protein
VVRVARVQPLISSPGRRPLPLNRVRRRLDHSDLVAVSQPLIPTSGAAGVLIRKAASRSNNRGQVLFCRTSNRGQPSIQAPNHLSTRPSHNGLSVFACPHAANAALAHRPWRRLPRDQVVPEDALRRRW